MSVVAAVARNYQVLIHRDRDNARLDVTAYCSGDTSGFYTCTMEPVGEDGIIRASGELTLQVPLTYLSCGTIAAQSDYDPWQTDWWEIGNRVIVAAADEQNTMHLLPINNLYILSNPTPATPPEWTLTLELGDYTTLVDSNLWEEETASPEGLAAPSTYLKSTRTRKEISSKLLGQEIEGDIPGGNVRGYTVPVGRPIAQLAGELAISAMSALWQNRHGTVETKRIVFNPAQRIFKHRIGIDDADNYELLAGPARPADEVEVISPEEEAEYGDDSSDDPNNDPDLDEEDREKDASCTTIEEFLSKAAISTSSTDAEEILAIVRKECWRWAGARYQETVEESRCHALVVPEDWYEFLLSQGRAISTPGPFDRIAALTSEENREFENSSDGRLLRIETRVAKTRGEMLTELYKRILQPNQPFPSMGDMILAMREETKYSYQTASGKDTQGQVRKIKTVRFEPLGLHAGSATDWLASESGGVRVVDNPERMICSYVKIEEWRKLGPDFWQYRLSEYAAGRARGGTRKALSKLIKIRGEVRTSRSGDIRPPAAERRRTESESQIRTYTTQKGKAKFKDDPKRKRQVEASGLESDADARALAEALGRLDIIRQKGFRITTALRNEWWRYSPLCRVDIWYNCIVWICLVDQLTIALGADSALVIADCVRTGRNVSTTVDSFGHFDDYAGG